MNKELQKPLEEMVMLLAVLVKRGSMQSTLVRELGVVGFKPKRIAELLGTTPNTVRVALHYGKRSKSKK